LRAFDRLDELRCAKICRAARLPGARFSQIMCSHRLAYDRQLNLICRGRNRFEDGLQLVSTCSGVLVNQTCRLTARS
jgi:hypothetical protein